MPKALLSWSSGKDSALALGELRRAADFEIAGLFTTLAEPFQRVAMHGVRVELLEAQAAAAGLPLEKIPLPQPCPNAEYERRVAEALLRWKALGVSHVAFGDLFLPDVRAYRERQLGALGLAPVFPLWGKNTSALADELLRDGFKARLTCVDLKKMPRDFAGREFDARLLQELPSGVDPCGENGEFHTFCSAGPIFSRPVPVRRGETVERDGFAFADLLPG